MLSLTGTSIETTESSCASGEGDSAAIAVEDGSVVVEGTLTASNPCHEAVLDSAELIEGALSVVVDVTDTSGDEACPSCVGAITYEATAQFSTDMENISELGGLTVDHAGGATYTLEEGELVPVDGSRGGTGSPPSTSGIAGRSIETLEATCGGVNDHEVTREDGMVIVEGSIPTSNPCHEAVLGTVSLADGSLAVEVGVRSTRGPRELCPDCIGEVSYRAEIALEAGTSVDSVDVGHSSPIQSPIGEHAPDEA